MQNIINEIAENARRHGSLPFWSWNGRLREDELRRQINNMHDLHMGGFFMHARTGLLTEYMSDEWFSCVNACIDEAKALGMEAWAYDENGWPSGFAGGLLLKDEANLAHFLKHEVSETFPDYDVLGVYVIQDGKARRVDSPCGAVYHIITVGTDNAYVDTLDGNITRKFIQSTYEQYKNRCTDFGTVMPGFFTDEPQYYRYAAPWSRVIPDAFFKKYGYPVDSLLVAMFEDFDGAQEFRYDYYYLCHQLFIENFSKVIYEWCSQNGCKLTGHTVEEASLSGQMWACGGAMPFYQYEHIPGIDYLGRGLDSAIEAYQLGSVCAQTGKKKAIAEIFGCCGWDVSPLNLKRIAELLYTGGVNVMCQHLYPYRLTGQCKKDYPAHYSRHLPWQNAMADFDIFFNNLGSVLSLGTDAAEVLVIHPMHSAYLNYDRRRDYASISQLEDKTRELMNLLTGNYIQFHFGDEWMMRDLACVEGSLLRVGECRYRYVIVPFVYTLDSSTVALLSEFASNGGRLLFLSDVQRVDGRKADIKLSGNITFEEIKASQGIDIIKTADARLNMKLRYINGKKMIYLVNISEETFDAVLTVKSCKGLTAVNMSDLSRANVDFTPGEPLTARLHFENSQSYVLLEDETAVSALPAPEKPHISLSGFTAAPVRNQLTLDRASVSYDGITYSEERPLVRIADELIQARYKGRVYLRFGFTVSALPDTLRLAAEPMSNAVITVNGSTAVPCADFFIDRDILTYDILSHVHTGSNLIDFSFDYFQSEQVYDVLLNDTMESLRNCLNIDTEVESIYLYGEFAVEVQNSSPAAGAVLCDGFSITRRRDQVNSADITGDGYPFFSGTMVLSAEYDFTPGGAAVLELGGHFADCSVYVNGAFASHLFFERRCDLQLLLKPGKNTIELHITGSNRNLLGPHHCMTPEPSGVGPRNFSFEKSWKNGVCPSFRENYALVPFGVYTK